MDHLPPNPATTVAWASPGTTSDAPKLGSAPTRFAEPRRRTRALAGSPIDRLQPRTVGQLLDGGFEVLRFRFRTIAIVSSVVVLPLYAVPQLVVVIAASLTGTSPADPAATVLGRTTPMTGDMWASIGLGYLAGLGLMLSAMLMGIALTHLVTSWLGGEDPSPRDVLRFLQHQLPRAFGAFGLALLLKAVALIPCGLGLLYVVPSLSLLAPVLAAERTSVTASISRSFRLTRRRFGTVLGATLGWAVCAWLVSVSADLAAAAVGSLATGSESGAATTVQAVDVVATVVLTVVQVAVTVLLYVDLRVRTEGLDLDLEARERFDAVR